MATTPSFSSFPERIKAEAARKPLASTEAPPATAFASFPERQAVPATQRDKHKSRRSDRDRDDSRPSNKRNKVSEDSDRVSRHKSSKARYDEDIQRHSFTASKVVKRDRRRSPRPEEQPEFRQQETAASTSSEWYIDTRGDPNNLRYGRLYAANVPRYNVRGLGLIIGLHAGMRLERENNRIGKGLVVADRSELSRSSGRLSKQSPYILQGPAKRVAIENGRDSLITSQADYLPLSRKTRKRKLGADQGVSNADILSRPQDIDSEAESVEESSSEESSDDQLDESSPAFMLRQRTISLERHLEEHPDDVDRWIEYSGLQSELLKAKEGDMSTLAVSEEMRTSSRRGFSEVSLSILEKALKAVPQNRLSSKLQLAYMRITEDVWPPARITSRWRWLLDQMRDTEERDERQHMDLWLAYIAWREGRGLGSHDQTRKGEAHGVEDVVTIYSDCISTMKKVMFDSYPGDAQQENLVYLVLRACLFLKQAGFSERALAVMQAMMELTFCKPQHMRRPVESAADAKALETELLEGLESFWDSDSPRIGESKSLGWHRWQGVSTEPVETPSQGADDSSDSPTDPYSSWYLQEEQAQLLGKQPAKASDLTTADDEDPFRVVLFSDISDFLFLITAPTAKLQLAYAVLNFLGLPFTLQETGTDTPFASDPYLTSNFGAAAIQHQSFWPVQSRAKLSMDDSDWTQVEPSTWQQHNPFQSPIRFWSQLDDNVLPSGESWFEVLKKPDTVDLDSIFVRNIFSSLRSTIIEPGFTAAYLAFEAASKNVKSASKMAKGFLSDDRENLFLWSSYASLISSQKGRVAEARHVYIACLSLERKPDDPYVVELFANWAEMEWLRGEEPASLAVAVAAFSAGSIDLTAFLEEGGPPAPTAPAILRARRTALELSGSLPLAHLKLNLLFVYLINDCRVEDAVVYLHNYLAQLLPSSPESEEAYQVGCHLIFYHSRRKATRGALFRSFLEEAINLFPNNTMFLSLYLFGEANGRVFGRVHKLLNEKLLNDSASVTTFLWAAWAEAQMAAQTFWDEHGGGAERVRGVFLKGVESAQARRSVTFWRLYIDFEITQKRVHQAKALCYRAVGELSASKDLHMLPFTPRLREHFSSKELQDWADLMIERGLRIRIPFDRHFSREDAESHSEVGEDVDVDGGDGRDDDPLEFLQERKRLMPY